MSLKNIWLQSKSFLVSSWKFFAGGLVVIVGFYSNFVDLKKPDVSIEITEIKQITSADFDVQSSPEFTSYRQLMSGDISFKFFGIESGDKLKNLQVQLDRKSQDILDQ